MKSFWNKYKHFIIMVLGLMLLTTFAINANAQVGSVKTEKYQADFEKKQSIELVADYDGPVIPIQILKIGINEELFESYPELKDKRVGLGVTNIVLEYLEYTNRFEFTEDRAEIKEKMITQFKASAKGFTENKIDGKGKIKLARYFVYIEVYDFSVAENEIFDIKAKEFKNNSLKSYSKDINLKKKIKKARHKSIDVSQIDRNKNLEKYELGEKNNLKDIYKTKIKDFEKNKNGPFNQSLPEKINKKLDDEVFKFFNFSIFQLSF
jgi:hypothetical protein